MSELEMTREELDFDLKCTLALVLHLYGVDGAHKVTTLVMKAREWREKTGNPDVLKALSRAIEGKSP